MRLDNCAIDYLRTSQLGVPITRMGLMTQAIATQVYKFLLSVYINFVRVVCPFVMKGTLPLPCYRCLEWAL